MQRTLNSKNAYAILGSLLCALYVLLAILVHRRVLVNVDHAITTLLQQIIPRSADLPASLLSLLGSAEVTVVIFAVLVLLSRPGVRVRLVLLFSLVALLELQGKLMINQPVPPDELLRYVFTFGTPTGELSTPYSYPSGHSARTSFLVSLAIILLLKTHVRLRTKTVLTALLLVSGAGMLLSRVYIGDHWTTDVAGGALLGVGLCLFAFLTD